VNHTWLEHASDIQGDISDLLDLADRNTPPWHGGAACKEAPESISWFSDNPRVTADAVKICQGCHVIEECRAWAFEQGAWLRGVWGGLTERERLKVRRPERRGRQVA
jgi:Transcription factor WhiB